MTIIEADEAFAALAMKREAVTEPVRTLRWRRDGLDHKTDVIVAVGIDEKHLAIEGQQGIKAEIPRSRHLTYVIIYW
jgi:hypothetical protein